MAISFEKLISDVQGLPDSTEISTKVGETVENLRLGDIRGQLSNTMARYEAALQTEREQRSTLEQTLKALKDTPAAPPVDRRETSATTPAGQLTDDDLDADPWVRKIMERTEKRIAAQLEPVRGEFKGFEDLSKKGVGALTSLLLRLQAAQDFGQHKDWPKDYDANRAYKEAGDRGYIDKSTGLPDLSRLHHELTEDQRVEVRARAMAEKMLEDDRKAQAEKNQGRFNKLGIPTGIRSKASAKPKAYQNLQEYMMSDDALPTDDEIRAAGGIMGAIR